MSNLFLDSINTAFHKPSLFWQTQLPHDRREKQPPCLEEEKQEREQAVQQCGLVQPKFTG